MSSKKLMVAGISAVAAFFGDEYVGINAKIDKMLAPAAPATPSTATPNIVMGAELGVGTLLLLSKGGRGAMGTAKAVAAGVSIGLGARRLAKKMGMVAGYQSTPVLAGRRNVGGYQNTPVLGGTGMPSALSGSGIPSALSGHGFRVNGPGYSPTGSGVGVMNGFGSRSSDRRNNSGYMR